MRVLLGLAALAAIAPGAPAQAISSSSVVAPSSGRVVMTWSQHHRRDGDGRFQGHVHHGVPPGYGYSGYGYAAGYNDYGDFDGNRSFDPDKWNDWWHERPDRAYPRWMSRNQDCSRRWYSGDVLTC
jgi:hypothetical protein